MSGEAIWLSHRINQTSKARLARDIGWTLHLLTDLSGSRAGQQRSGKRRDSCSCGKACACASSWGGSCYRARATVRRAVRLAPRGTGAAAGAGHPGVKMFSTCPAAWCRVSKIRAELALCGRPPCLLIPSPMDADAKMWASQQDRGLADLVSRLLVVDPAARLPALSALQHSFLHPLTPVAAIMRAAAAAADEVCSPAPLQHAVLPGSVLVE